MRSANPAVALVAQQRRAIAEEHEVEVVVVVVIDPDGGSKRRLGQLGRARGGTALHVAIEQRAGFRQDAKVHQAVVVEVAGATKMDALDRRRPDRRPLGAAAVELALRWRTRRAGRSAGSGAVDGEHAGGGAEGLIVDGGRSGGRGLARRIVDLGEVAPVHILGNGGAFGFFLQLLEGGELAGGIVRRPAWR